jgi:hypothetical protein
LQDLNRRIVETPEDFLRSPRNANSGDLVIEALVYDLLAMHGAAAGDVDINAFRFTAADHNVAGITAVMCWLMADPAFIAARQSTIKALAELLRSVPAELSAHCTAKTLVADADRREELARLTLARLGLRPAGESKAQAQDRLSTISSAERIRVIAASRAAEQRAREVREALARKAAEESADKWGRE